MVTCRDKIVKKTVIINNLFLMAVLQCVVCEKQDYNWTCQYQEICDYTDDIVTAIISDQENYQRLMDAFYPINHAVPQFATLVFFTNATPVFQPICSQTPYAGIITELNGEENVLGTMWYSSTTNMLATGTVLNEIGLFVPQIISGVFFKTNPIITDYPFVCLTVRFQVPQSESILHSVTLLVSLVNNYYILGVCMYKTHFLKGIYSVYVLYV